MASQGPFLVGTGAHIAGPDRDWTSPSLITADDGSNASVSLPSGQISDYLAGTNSGFTIPAGATINGIVVELNDATAFFGTWDLYLTKGGSTSVGTVKNPEGAVGWASYGAPTDLWGTTWTDTEVNASTFGALLRGFDSDFEAPTLGVDAFRITVYYTESGPPPDPVYVPKNVFDPLLLGRKAWF